MLSTKNLKTGAVQQVSAPPVHVVYGGGHYVQFAAAANRAKGNTPRAGMTKEHDGDPVHAADARHVAPGDERKRPTGTSGVFHKKWEEV